jgi:hypothetical protein
MSKRHCLFGGDPLTRTELEANIAHENILIIFDPCTIERIHTVCELVSVLKVSRVFDQKDVPAITSRMRRR